MAWTILIDSGAANRRLVHHLIGMIVDLRAKPPTWPGNRRDPLVAHQELHSRVVCRLSKEMKASSIPVPLMILEILPGQRSALGANPMGYLFREIERGRRLHE
jgi:hypothetical protein